MLRALRFVAGAAVGLAVWWYATPAYDRFLCAALRVAGMRAEAFGRMVRATRVDAPFAQLPADQLTYNMILFAGLIAAATPRRVWRAIAALLALVATHVLALAVTIQNAYVNHSGKWGDTHYSDFAHDFWEAAEYIYRIGGMFAIAFVCWYLAATWAAAPGRRRESSRKSERDGRGRRRAPGSRR